MRRDDRHLLINTEHKNYLFILLILSTQAKMFQSVAVLALAATTVLGHAVVETPEPRKPGAASLDLCGAAVSKVLERGQSNNPPIFH